MLIEEITGNSGIYIGYKISSKSIQEINAWMKDLGVNPIPSDKFHLTLIQSTSPKISVESFKPLGKISTSIRLNKPQLNSYPVGIGLVDGLVLAFESHELRQRRTDIGKEFGIKKWKRRWSPHLSISYNYDRSLGSLEKIPVPITSLELSEEYAEPIDLGWVQST